MITKYGDVSTRTGGYAVGKFLKRARGKALIGLFGQTDVHGKNKGRERIFRRILPFLPATTPLADGITPEGQQLTKEDITAYLEEYGDIYPYTNRLKEVHEDNKGNRLLDDMSENAGKTAIETLELVRYAVLKAGTNVFYANGVASRATVAGPAVRDDFRKIERSLLANHADYHEEMISGSVKIGTTPIEACFIAFCHTDLKADLEQLSGWTKVADYADDKKKLPGEMGCVGAIRFLGSPLFASWQEAGASGSTMLTAGGTGTGNADVYPIIVVAKDAFSVVPLVGKDAVDMSIIQPKKTETDPLAQRGVIGWKAWDSCVILQQAFVCRLEVAASQL